MDCCGSSKPKEPEKDIKASQMSNGNNSADKETKIDNQNQENNPIEKEQTHAGGCCGGGWGMWLHLIIMFIVFIAIWYFQRGR